MTDHSIEDAAIDALLIALALQASELSDRRFAISALEHVVSCGRATVRRLLGSIGHLIHYDAAEEDGSHLCLAALLEQLIAVVRRTQDREAPAILPGDIVEMVRFRPDLHLQAGLRMRVYWVGDDGTVDVGYESIAEEYVVSTVDATDVRGRATT